MDFKKDVVECKCSFRKSRNLIRSLASLLVCFNRFNLRSSFIFVWRIHHVFIIFCFYFSRRQKNAVSCDCILQLSKSKSKSSLLLAGGVKKTRQRCWSFKISSNFKRFNETTTAPWHWVKYKLCTTHHERIDRTHFDWILFAAVRVWVCVSLWVYL